jgi:hypothetical protein
MALLTLAEAAYLLKISPSAIRRRVQAGMLHVLHPEGGPARVALAEVLALASAERSAPLPAERHVCLFVRTPSQVLAALLELIAAPLAAGVAVALALDEPTARLELLLANPIAQRAHLEGRLAVLEADALFLGAGQFDAVSHLDRLTRMSADMGALGRPFVFAGEMTWAARWRIGVALTAYEARLNSWLDERPDFSLICVYDASRFDGEVALSILQSHPVSCVDGVCRAGIGQLVR